MSIELAGREVELDGREVRVVGCLIEKELSTPDYYPMTVNALTAACNQKTNREPVVAYSESEVRDTLDQLQRNRLVGSASSPHARTGKYRHALAEMLDLAESHLAILSSLMLRGPQTAGELRSRTSRMHAFESLEAVDAVLDELAARDPSLVAELPVRPGQKEARFIHLFSGRDEIERELQPTDARDDGGRIEELARDLDELRESVSRLEDELRAFKKQFE
ncbi:MAG: YceH family protein [Rhodothermales bacterium]